MNRRDALWVISELVTASAALMDVPACLESPCQFALEYPNRISAHSFGRLRTCTRVCLFVQVCLHACACGTNVCASSVTQCAWCMCATVSVCARMRTSVIGPAGAACARRERWCERGSVSTSRCALASAQCAHQREPWPWPRAQSMHRFTARLGSARLGRWNVGGGPLSDRGATASHRRRRATPLAR